MSSKAGLPFTLSGGCHRVMRIAPCALASAQRFSTVPSRAPLRMAIVGSGPAGFYTAARVLSRLPDTRIDMYEALPVPFGLVRYGVAPDHPEVKNCQSRFAEIAESPRFQFLGNVSIGRPGHLADTCTVPFESLMRHYDSVVMAYGASQDRQLSVPGESSLGGVYSARQFVGWYNGLPESAGLDPDLTRGEDAVIIGQGNVALDLARMLLESVQVLSKTDIADHALATLANSRIKRVRVVARRGPMQAAFTIKEVRELMKLPTVAFEPMDRSLIPEDIKSLPRISRRLMEVLLKGSDAPSSSSTKSWSLDSCLSPLQFLSRDGSSSHVAETEFTRTRLAVPFDPQTKAVATKDTLILPSDIVIRSVGYKSVSLPGFAEAGIPFDEERGIMVNDGSGRVMRSISEHGDDTSPSYTEPFKGIYCAGWVKRGPTGVIATTMLDAFETGDAIVQDWLAGIGLQQGRGESSTMGGWEAVKRDAGPSAAYAISWEQWRDIDTAERERGKARGKEREKFTSTADMLSAVR
ncbi:hypothetical protein HIM_02756 [Hirsutella minnesotensis 3608]|nr:hypothetical protein HIM_02756 [Hirsutella minnesotensis 3608]